MRVSFCADDAALFLNPVKEEVKFSFDLLEFFWQHLWAEHKSQQVHCLPN
jgi:hypothetical protein